MDPAIVPATVAPTQRNPASDNLTDRHFIVDLLGGVYVLAGSGLIS